MKAKEFFSPSRSDGKEGFTDVAGMGQQFTYTPHKGCTGQQQQELWI
jgi:hypothetical protein